jgi:tetratricopeptide (TPR) repeat protein
MKNLFPAGLLIPALAAVLLAPGASADYKQAVAYYNQKRYTEAIQELKPDLDKNPNWEFGHRLLGLCYLALDNNALAANSLSYAAKLKSTAFSTYYGLGQAYFNMQKYDDSISALNQAEPLAEKEKDPAEKEKSKTKLYRLRGSAYYRMNEFDEAAGDLTKALKTDPSSWADYSMLGVSYFNLNRTDEAIQALEKAHSMKPGQSATVETLGKIYLKAGTDALSQKQYAAAASALQKAKEYDPKNGYICYNLAEAYLFSKKYPEAEKELIQAAEMMPQSAEVYERMGLVYEMQKKWDLALKSYEKGNRIRPSKSIQEALERVENNLRE